LKTIPTLLLRPIKLTLHDDSKFRENVLKMINLQTPIVNAITFLESNHKVRAMLNDVKKKKLKYAFRLQLQILFFLFLKN